MNVQAQKVLGVVLAGGAASRMGGADKGAARCRGKRLVDHVIHRLAPQVSEIIIAGTNAYGTPYEAVPDRDGAPFGPVAALKAAASWAGAQEKQFTHLMSVPVDMPVIRPDTATLLRAAGENAFAIDADHAFSALALWSAQSLQHLFRSPEMPEAPSLRWVAKELGASAVQLPAPSGLVNLNTPDDVAAFEQELSAFS